MTMISDLPGDLLEDILRRVPATSLKRLRSSCKRWNRLFNDEEFARKHLYKATKESFVFTVTKDFGIYLLRINQRRISMESKGELSPIDGKFIIISEVFHCDGLLLCTFDNKTRIMLWNPFTGQTSWEIQPFDTSHTYTRLLHVGTYATLKGKTYWFASDGKGEQLNMFLVSFDYTTERFGRLSLPCNCSLDSLQSAALSVVSEEKLAVLLQPKNTREKEIWISNKIDGAKEVTWRKFLKVDYPKDDNWISISRFLVDEEKKVALCCEVRVPDRFTTRMKKLIFIAGEDHKVTLMASGEVTSGSFWPIVLD